MAHTAVRHGVFRGLPTAPGNVGRDIISWMDAVRSIIEQLEVDLLAADQDRIPEVKTVTFSATPTFDTRGSVHKIFELGAMTANITSITINNAMKGQILTFRFLQDGTGGRTIAGWPGGVKLSGGSFTPTSTADKSSIISFYYDGASYWEIARSLDQ